jgi:TonB family protein
MSFRIGAAVVAAALLLGAFSPHSSSAQTPSDSSWGDRFYGREEEAPPSPGVVAIAGLDAEGGWGCRVDSGEAVATLRRFPEASSSEAGERYALGLKVEFLTRAKSSAIIFSSRPLPLQSRCAMLSLRVLGRNSRHKLSLVVLDYYGKRYELPLGRLDFTGWKRLYAYVPRFDPATGAGIVQDDSHFERPPGLRVEGLRLDFDLDESYGSFYVYFDSLEATVERGRGDGEVAPSAAAQAEPPVPGPEPEANEKAKADEASSLILTELSRRIAASLIFPDAARRRGIEGTVVVSFAVDGSGALASASVERSSGSEILDKAALELLMRVFPVENAARVRLSLRISIGYKLAD